MKNVTLNLIRNNYKNNKPCEQSWIKLLKSLNKTKADNDPISFEYLLETLGVQDTLWVVDNCIEDKSVVRLMCADFAESVLHIWENWAWLFPLSRAFRGMLTHPTKKKRKRKQNRRVLVVIDQQQVDKYSGKDSGNIQFALLMKTGLSLLLHLSQEVQVW